MDFDSHFKKYDEEYGFNGSELCSFEIGYENGIALGNLSKRSRLIISNEYGYLGYYWGYKSFRPAEIKITQDLNDLKSHAINCGAKIDWDTYQWVLNNFDMLIESCKKPF